MDEDYGIRISIGWPSTLRGLQVAILFYSVVFDQTRRGALSQVRPPGWCAMICNICYREALKAGLSTASVASCTVCHRRACRHEVMDAAGRCGWCHIEANLPEPKKAS